MLNLILAAGLSAASADPAAAAANATPIAPSTECEANAGPMLSLTPEEFDQGPTGWRVLTKKRACAGATAEVIASYRIANWAKLKPNYLHLLYWHEGQLRAMAGEKEAAVPLLMAGVGPTGSAFANYALATIAFLHNDLEALKAARVRLAGLPEPASFRQSKGVAGQSSQRSKWPPNLDVVDGLIACFGKSYDEAYSPNCRPK